MSKQTAMQEAIKEIAYLWGSPSDQPTYTKIFEILESKLDIEKQEITNAYRNGKINQLEDSEQYYNETFK